MLVYNGILILDLELSWVFVIVFLVFFFFGFVDVKWIEKDELNEIKFEWRKENSIMNE